MNDFISMIDFKKYSFESLLDKIFLYCQKTNKHPFFKHRESLGFDNNAISNIEETETQLIIYMNYFSVKSFLAPFDIHMLEQFLYTNQQDNQKIELINHFIGSLIFKIWQKKHFLHSMNENKRVIFQYHQQKQATNVADIAVLLKHLFKMQKIIIETFNCKKITRKQGLSLNQDVFLNGALYSKQLSISVKAYFDNNKQIQNFLDKKQILQQMKNDFNLMEMQFELIVNEFIKQNKPKILNYSAFLNSHKPLNIRINL